MNERAELFQKLARVRRERPDDRRATEVKPHAGLPADLAPVTSERGDYLERTRRHPRETVHGRFALSEIRSVRGADLAFLTRDRALATLAVERAVFLDIETTALAGGAGTIPFLVALGSFTDQHFVLWQGFLPSPAGEAALLEEVAQRIRAASGVVSFFGKTFDRHRLEDKMRLHGIEPPFAGLAHLDLYHPCARLYRDALGDGRLCTFESALCGVARAGDLPGSQAPEAWFDFLAGRGHRLEAVFRHNELDVLALVVLAAHLGRTLEERRVDDTPLEGPAGTRAAAIARLWEAEGEHAEALDWTERALGRTPQRVRGLEFLRAMLKRRLGRYEQALAEFARITEGERDELALRALIEIAKLCEHRFKDADRAREAVQKARDLARSANPSARASVLADLAHRAARLELRRKSHAAPPQKHGLR